MIKRRVKQIGSLKMTSYGPANILQTWRPNGTEVKFDLGHYNLFQQNRSDLHVTAA